jgi:hypothetical protein
MIYFSGALILVVLIAVCRREGWKLTPLVLLYLSWSPIAVGYVGLDALNGTDYSIYYSLAFTAFAIGYFLHQKKHATPTVEPLPDRVYPPQSDRAVKWFVGIVVAFTCYHFVAGGVPLFSENVEVRRFDFTSSGFFGIPGRMYQYGLPFAAMMVSIAAVRGLAHVSRRLLWGLWGFYVLTALVGGFKGGLYVLVGNFLLVNGVAGTPLHIWAYVGGRRALLLLASLAVAMLVAAQYETAGISGLGGYSAYILFRATLIGAQPGHVAFNEYGMAGTGGHELLSEFSYYASKYFPFLFTRGAADFPLDMKVSSLIYGTELSDQAFIVPVTVGAFPEFVVHFGALVGLVLIAALGVLFSYLLFNARKSSRLFAVTASVFAMQILLVHVLNGGAVYHFVNCVLMLIILGVLYTLSRSIAGKETAPESQPNAL